MAGSETSFDSYTFAYKWKINDLAARIYNASGLSSPTFCSPSGATPATKWMLCLNMPNCDLNPPRGYRQPLPTDHGERSERYKSLNLELKRLPSSPETTPGHSKTKHAPGPLRPPQSRGLAQGASVISGHSALQLQQLREADVRSVWVEASLTPFISTGDTMSKCTCISQGPLCCHGNMLRRCNSVICFQHFLTESKIRGSHSVTLECEIKVWLLDKPVHINKEPLSLSSKSDFNLVKSMEEARQNDLFTDVTLVADGKEFKAHKVVLASQSQFFKTRFASRWSGSAGDKVEMTDISASIMEAILSYMYTGTVTDIDKIAYQLLPVAEEYALVSLRGICEETLAKSLTISSAIDVLIHADAHNIVDLKKACMDFILSNIAPVKQSEGWSKLKKDAMHRDLWVELLESITEKHFAASTTISAHTKSEEEAEPEDPFMDASRSEDFEEI